MKIDEFIEETANIEKYYDKELDEFQRKVWYDELCKIDISKYRMIIKEIYRHNKFMPKLADIIEINSNLTYKPKEIIEETVECNRCNSKGYIFYKKIVKNGAKDIIYDMFARCDCKNGLKYAYDGTKINNTEHRSKFYVPTISQLGM